MNIIIFGAGGVGGYLGAKLQNAGNNVALVARGEHLKALQQHGLTLQSPQGNIHVRATFTEDLTYHPPVDLVIVAVKSFDTITAAQQCRDILQNTTAVLSIQNGVENEAMLGTVLGHHHVVGGVAYIFSTIAAPGIIRHEGQTAKFKFGEMNGKISQRCKEIELLFQSASIDAEAVPTITKTLWEKFIFICGLAGMTAFAQKPIGEILDDPSLSNMLDEVVHEAAEVGRQKQIDRFDGIEDRAVAHFRRLPFDSTSSMYYDLIHKKRLEVEALNGAVVRFGGELQISCPANKKIYSTLSQH